MFEPAWRESLLQEGVELDSLIEWVLRILMSYFAVSGPPARRICAGSCRRCRFRRS